MKPMMKVSIGILLVIVLSLVFSVSPAWAAGSVETNVLTLKDGGLNVGVEWADDSPIGFRLEYTSINGNIGGLNLNLSTITLGTNIYFSDEALTGIYIGSSASLYLASVEGSEETYPFPGLGLVLGCRLTAGSHGGISVNGGVNLDMLFNLNTDDVVFLYGYYVKAGFTFK